MGFEENIKNHSQRIKTIYSNISTEEATKTSLIMPFFQILGYDVFNPTEFVPEFTADVGIKKGEKVDYAILQNGKPTILIECKSVEQVLTKYDSQLFRYFGTSSAKFAILTNGIIYRFFTDLDESNKMDEKPFLEIDMLKIKDNQIAELKKFCKEHFDIENIVDTAAELKYLGLIRNVLIDLFTNNPPDDFVKLILNSGVFDGVKTQNIIDKYRPLVRKSIALYINDLVNDRLQNALSQSEQAETHPNINDDSDEDNPITSDEHQIVTTVEEMESYYIIKSMLCEKVAPGRIEFKDTLSYFAILLDGKVTRWICRVYIKESIKYILIRNDNEEDEKFIFENINELYQYRELLEKRLSNIL